MYCPSCGYNLTRDEVIERDGFMLDPRGVAAFGGGDLGMTPGEALVLYAVARGGGRPVQRNVILSRISDGCDPNIVSVLLSRARSKLMSRDVASPIKTVHGRGYAWGLI